MTLRQDHPAEYTAWCSMRQRCTNSNRDSWDDYGGRGIAVCAEWDDFEVFLADVGPRPSKLHSLERRDNDGGYEPANCYWATRTEQAANRRAPRIPNPSGFNVVDVGWLLFGQVPATGRPDTALWCLIHNTSW